MNTNETNPIDLGSIPADDFDPFASDEELIIDTTAESSASEQASTQDNPLDTAINTAETKEALAAQQSLAEKEAMFEYAGASEAIADSSITFDELRIEKSADFPELDDGKRVSWTVEYGKITKTITDPKAMSVGKMKSEIETSKDFLDSLKKAKDKNPVCKLKPKVTAQNKGVISAYKGIFNSLGEADAAGKVISIVPGRDGQVYEIRRNALGRFITPVRNCDMLSDIRAGFDSALPHIPMDMMMRIVSFFRYCMHTCSGSEALLNIYWDRQNREFVIDAPKQTVTKVSVDSHISDDYADDRYMHYMDIHSHTSMRAFFSSIDDDDEKATRLYTVIGNLDKYFPTILTRISNGGKFCLIDPSEVFEAVTRSFPDEWKNNVQFRASHSDDMTGGDIA